MADNRLDDFQTQLQEFDIELNDVQLQQFMRYYELLVEWNSFMNLTAITEFHEVLTKHFVDSLSIVKAIDLKNAGGNQIQKVIDIGTGAGFPGIPLKIVFPDLKITLLDSLNKRIKFLNEVISELGMKDIEALHGRAEDYAKPDQRREQYDLCVSRAVANLATLSEYCIPYVKRDGYFISYKSEKSAEELSEAKKAIQILGGCIDKQVELTLPNSEIYRNLVVIKKVKVTPGRYPRKSGLPSKEPIK